MSELKKMKKNRFSCQEDIFLLREAVVQNPYKEESMKEMKKVWAQVLHNFMMICPTVRTERAIREHVEYLLQLYINEDLSKLRRSGNDEFYEEKEQLLEDLKCLKEFHQPPSKKNRKIAESLRQEATSLAPQKRIVPKGNCEPHAQYLPPTQYLPSPTPVGGIKSSVTPPTVPNPDPTPSSATLKFIRLEHRKLTIKEKREENESRRISVEEKKVENEARRLALEERKQAAFEDGQKQQLELMALLIEKISKP